MEIKEVGNKVEKSIKQNKGILITGGVVVGLFAVSYLIQSKNSGSVKVSTVTDDNTDLVAVNGAYASYPDAVTNADVITSTLQNNMDFLLDDMKEQMTEQMETIDSKFEAVNKYIDDGLKKNAELSQTNYDKLSDSIDALASKMSTSGGTPVSTPSYGYTPPSSVEQSKMDLLNNLHENGSGNIVTSNGLTVAQNASLLGTSYNGSTVKGVSTLGTGETVIETSNGKKYVDGKEVNGYRYEAGKLVTY